MLRDLVPPLIWRMVKKLYLALFPSQKRYFFEWQYLPEGWRAARNDPSLKGWDVESVLEAYKANWPTFVKNLESTSPLGISLESNLKQHTNIIHHNIVMTYGYVLAYCVRYKSRISMLDWGGGIGHYYLLSQALLPDLTIEYHCKDFARFIEYGKQLFPEAYFYSDRTCLTRKYDFVLASSSLQYSQDCMAVLQDLAQATSGYLFITRLPLVQHVPSYVIAQRPYQYGYNTEYLGWCLNHDEFLHIARKSQLQLIREFIIEESYPIDQAPEQPKYFGFLFSKRLV